LGTYTFDYLRKKELEISMETLRKNNLKLSEQVNILNRMNLGNKNIIEKQKLEIQEALLQIDRFKKIIEDLEKNSIEASKKGIFRRMLGL
jgi:phosphopantothenate synthetase